MRLLVDGWELLPHERRRGIGRFLAGVLPHLAAAPDIEVAVLQPSDEVGAIELPDGCRARPVRRRFPRTRVRAGIGEHVLRIPGELRRTGHDVAWQPGTLPFASSPRPWLQTIHDLAPLVLDDPAYRFHRAHWRLLGPRVRRAGRVVAVSRFAADEARAILGVPADRIEVVPHGLDPSFCPGDVPVSGAGSYVAAVTTDDPRKNLDALARVARHLAATATPLRVAGRLGPSWRSTLEAAGAEVVGHVADLPAFYRGAVATVVTSRYEGFGFVPLESMACGTPVVAFDTTAVGEIAGPAGVLVPLDDVTALCRELDTLRADPSSRAQRRAAGLAHAGTFRWERAAASYAEVVRSLA